MHQDYVYQQGMEFLSFQIQGEANKWWRAYMECRCSTLPPLTWSPFYVFFLEKYVSRTLGHHKKVEFMELKKGGIFVTTYKANIHDLFTYSTQLVITKEERIRLIYTSLNIEFQVLSVHMTSSWKIFNEFIGYIKKVEG